MEVPEHPKSRLYGRRKGRPLHVRKAALMQELLPRYRLTLPSSRALETHDLAAEQTTAPRPLWLEVGFGGGEHLAAQAKNHPETLFIGCEPFLNGVAGLLAHIDREGLTNIRIFNDDARLVLDALPDASLDKCFVLFADPWPKKRHARRRFIGPENLDRLARVLKRGARLRLASDHPALIAWMHECLSLHPDFVCVHASEKPPADWIGTRYEEKAVKAGRQPFYMEYKRK